MSSRRSLPTLLAIAVCGWSFIGQAQSRTLEQRQQQLRAAPDDTRLLCEVGWAELLAGRDVLAERHLRRGIELLGEPTDRALRNRLAACLYSLGRWLERAQPEQAIASYDRSLSLRPNRIVSERLAALRAIEAAQWNETEAGAPSADLLTAIRAILPALAADDYVDVQTHLVSPDGRREALLVEARTNMLIALREERGPWTIAPFAERENPNGSDDFELEVAPSPSAWPTFVVRERWDHRTCCDDEGYPDWTQGSDVHLVWLGEDGAPHAASLADPDDAFPDVPVDVTFTPDGRVIVERPRGRITARVRRLLGAHDRADWLERRD